MTRTLSRSRVFSSAEAINMLLLWYIVLASTYFLSFFLKSDGLKSTFDTCRK